mmetsp:Transcript_71328/g.225352  ORF Transcript_71328/g.225352 Transcript_71328/m.225352 type:complete len:126 (+) Transcript_71328:1306-1683(+)
MRKEEEDLDDDWEWQIKEIKTEIERCMWREFVEMKEKGVEWDPTCGKEPTDATFYDFLYGDGISRDPSWTGLAAFAEEMRTTGFVDIQARMLSFLPSLRPTPAEVLNATYMKEVRTLVDPDYGQQ